MMQNRDSNFVHQYFNRVLGLHFSQDFRGVLYVPEQFINSQVSLDHVAIAVGYNAFIGRTCCMHSVITRPEAVTRRIVQETFEFPFVRCNCEAVIALVDSKNDAAMNFDTKLGFKQIAVIPNGGPEADLNVLQMLRADCKWLRRATH